MTRDDTEGQAPGPDVAREARLRAVAEATLVGVQATLVSISIRNRELEEERDRLTREIAALARLLADSGLLQGVDPKRVAAVARQQHDVVRRMKDAEARAKEARQKQAEAEGRYRGIVKSTSWRVTGPLRRVIRLVRGR